MLFTKSCLLELEREKKENQHTRAWEGANAIGWNSLSNQKKKLKWVDIVTSPPKEKKMTPPLK